GVRKLIEDAGAELRYLPPYCPDFNPIEPCWSVVKQRLRQLKATSLAALDLAIPQALSLISPTIAQNCFRHCGYASC
ncbi:MAG: IS630 family transposase, partial [Acidobacteria bacterium]|nr:IS630 family transposase [Acidobacteriota bacterium]